LHAYLTGTTGGKLVPVERWRKRDNNIQEILKKCGVKI